MSVVAQSAKSTLFDWIFCVSILWFGKTGLCVLRVVCLLSSRASVCVVFYTSGYSKSWTRWRSRSQRSPKPQYGDKGNVLGEYSVYSLFPTLGDNTIHNLPVYST